MYRAVRRAGPRDTAAHDVAAVDRERKPNGYDLVSFGLQLIQVAPIAAGLFGGLLHDAWLVRAAVTLAAISMWALAIRINVTRRRAENPVPDRDHDADGLPREPHCGALSHRPPGVRSRQGAHTGGAAESANGLPRATRCESFTPSSKCNSCDMADERPITPAPARSRMPKNPRKRPNATEGHSDIVN
jgi:hypothetical protein